MDVTVLVTPRPAALAPRTRATQVDPPEGAPAWPAAARRRGRRAGAAAGQGEPALGCVRICGELRKPGIRVGATTVGTLLRRHGWARRRGAAGRPGHSSSKPCRGVVACDLLTVETSWLQTPDVLFFIQVSTRQVVAAGVTAQPDSAWVARQARNAAMDLNDRQLSTRVPAPRPRRQVHQWLRHRVPRRTRGGHPHADPGAASERLRRAVGADRPGGVPGLDAGAGPAPPAAAAGRLRPALQPAATAPRPWVARSPAWGAAFKGRQRSPGQAS